jgi:CubicO group peptidase (beta-lactamase class C family)
MKVHEYLERATPFGFSGACLVGVGDEIVLNAGYGRALRDEGVENDAETVFSLGSVTKQFTAAAILKLAEEGRLQPEDPVGRFVDVPADKAEIELHHLLTHTSGLAMYTGDDYEAAGRDETVARMLGEELRFAPGSDYAYSNAGYSLLAAVVELVSEVGYEEYVREQLLLPARLETTGYRLPDWSGRVVAHWYAGDVDNGTPLGKPYPSWNVMGNGDMLSTTADLWRWHRALRDDTVLSAESRRRLFTPYAADYGYGWRVVDGARGRLVEHGGASSYGSSCAFKRFLDEEVVVVLFSNVWFGSGPLAQIVEDHVVAAAFGEDVPLPPLAEEMPGFAGAVYSLPSGGRLSLDGSALAAVGQDGIDELAFDGASQVKLNDRALVFVRSVLSGDEDALRKEVGGDSQRMERYRRLIRAVDGDVSVAATIPSHLAGVPATHVRVADEAIALYWREGELLGLGPGDPEAGYQIRIARSHDGYIGYDLRQDTVVRVGLGDDHLTLSSGRRTVRAERV